MMPKCCFLCFVTIVFFFDLYSGISYMACFVWCVGDFNDFTDFRFKPSPISSEMTSFFFKLSQVVSYIYIYKPLGTSPKLTIRLRTWGSKSPNHPFSRGLGPLVLRHVGACFTGFRKDRKIPMHVQVEMSCWQLQITIRGVGLDLLGLNANGVLVRLACCEMDVLFLKFLPSMKLTAFCTSTWGRNPKGNSIEPNHPWNPGAICLFQGGYLNGIHGTIVWYIHRLMKTIKIKHKYTNVPLVCVGLLVDPESYPETKRILVVGDSFLFQMFFQVVKVVKFAELVDSGQTDFHIFHIFQGLKTEVMISRRVPHN